MHLTSKNFREHRHWCSLHSKFCGTCLPSSDRRYWTSGPCNCRL